MHNEDCGSNASGSLCDYGEDDCVVIERSSDESCSGELDMNILHSDVSSSTPDNRETTEINLAAVRNSKCDFSKNQPLPASCNVKPLFREKSEPFYSNLKSCENCGKLGVPDTFYARTGSGYSRQKRFCTKACAQFGNWSIEENTAETDEVKTSLAAVSQPASTVTSSSSSQLSALLTASSKSNTVKRVGQGRTFDWKQYIQRENAVAASVSCFKHCPMSQCWNDDLFCGVKIEIPNTNTEISAYTVYWIAIVINVQGYGAQVRYEGCEDDTSHDVWINLTSKDVHPIGWCSANVKPLVPPKFLQFKVCDWKEYLLKKLTGAKTLPSNFHAKIMNSIKRCPLKQKMKLEVIDKLCLSTMTVATVEEITGGRLKLRYMWSELGDDFFWCHSLSTLIHPVGWSQLVGHQLRATAVYKASMANKLVLRNFKQDEATPDMFCKVETRRGDYQFESGMKLEAVDPLNLASICVASVHQVLRNGYLMIGIDTFQSTPHKTTHSERNDLFCYHSSSPYIFPAGFCQQHFLKLTVPKGCKMPFCWQTYLQVTNSLAAPEHLFNKNVPKHCFKPGMKLEAVDLMDPKLICIATVVSVVGRLLKIHFDGWDNTYDQWMDCLSPDIYPCGWTDIVDIVLEGPQEIVSNRTDKKRSKSRASRKKKKHKQNFSATGFEEAPSTDYSYECSDSQSMAGSQLSSPVTKKSKIDDSRLMLAAAESTSPEPPPLVELSPRSDFIPSLELSSQTSENDSTTPRSMPHLLVSANR